MTFEEWCDKERLSCQYSYQLDALEDAWNARIPEGYVLVPVEHTAEMMNAFLDIYDNRGWFSRAYKAMIQAAQETKDA